LDTPPARIDDDPEAIRVRDDAVLELLYGSGLRISELCGLRPADIDLRAAAVTVWGKGGKQRQVPITPPAADALRALLAQEPANDAVFRNARGKRLTPRDARRILDRRALAPTHPH